MSPTARSLFLLHLPANALLLWLGYKWLGMGEATFFEILWSAAVALVLLMLVCWLYGATFVGFRYDAKYGVAGAFATALRNLFPLLVMVVGSVAMYSFLFWLTGHSFKPAAMLASWLTFHMRKPVQAETVLRSFNAIFWVVLQADLLPMFSAVAAHGWDGFGEFGWRCYSRFFRLEVPLLIMCVVWLPFLVLEWVPHVNGFDTEMTFFVLQAGLAYLIFVVAMLLLAALTSRGKPAVSQFRTVPSR